MKFLCLTPMNLAASVEILESLLLLSANMNDGAGVLFPCLPHQKTPQQLLHRLILCNPALRNSLINQAITHGNLAVTQWLHQTISYKSKDGENLVGSDAFRIFIYTAATCGQLEIFRWLTTLPDAAYDTKS